MKSATVVLLDDDDAPHQKLDACAGAIAAGFNDFVHHNFYEQADQPNAPSIKIQLVHAKSPQQLVDELFGKGTLLLRGSGSDCILFFLDYVLDKNSGASLENCQVEYSPGRSMLFTEWLAHSFPHVPKVILTALPDPQTVSREVKSTLGDECQCLHKDILDNPERVRSELVGLFSQWSRPVFWRELRRYAMRGVKSFHTPGHNWGDAFARSIFQRGFYNTYGGNRPGTGGDANAGGMIFKTDLSVSVDELGDLSEPDKKSPLTQAQKLSARIFGAHETLFITNGTSTSNKAMLMTLLRPGETVLLDRNCHKSVHQAVVFSGAIPLYLPAAFNDTFNVWAPVERDTITRIVEGVSRWPPKDRPRMLVLTTATYEGVLYPINEIAKLCEANGMLFYADEAWAPYLRFHPYYRYSPHANILSRYNATDGGAHFIVQSTHKALAAFSQASMIHVSKGFFRLLQDDRFRWLSERFRIGRKGSYARFRHELLEVLRYWHSTSPHYPMMATLDCAGVQMRLEGMSLLNERLQWADQLRVKFGKSILGLAAIGGKSLVGQNFALDPLKLVVGFKSPEAGKKLKTVLQEAKIQWEKSTVACIEFLITIGTFRDQIYALDALLGVNSALLARSCEDFTPGPDSYALTRQQVQVTPREAALSESKLVPLEKAVGQIAAQMLVPYPPGIPVFLPGLRITDAMRRMVAAVADPHEVHGLYVEDGKSYVRVMAKFAQKKQASAPSDSLRTAEVVGRMSALVDAEIQRLAGGR